MSRKNDELLDSVFSRVNRNTSAISDEEAETIEIENHEGPHQFVEPINYARRSRSRRCSLVADWVARPPANRIRSSTWPETLPPSICRRGWGTSSGSACKGASLVLPRGSRRRAPQRHCGRRQSPLVEGGET